MLNVFLLLSLLTIGQIASIEGDNFDEEQTYPIGALSAKWESGNKGPGTVSNSYADPGGFSYGTYQISTKHGYINDFLQNEGASFCDYFDELQPGTEAFNKQWRSIANKQEQIFHQSQHQYIKRTHYDPFVRRLRLQLGIEIEQFTPVFKDVLWSTSVQHGPYTKVVRNALTGQDRDTLSESELIQLIYKERARQIGGHMAYFPRIIDSWKQHIIQRFELELKDALQRLDDYTEQSNDSNTTIAAIIEDNFPSEASKKSVNGVKDQSSKRMTIVDSLPAISSSRIYPSHLRPPTKSIPNPIDNTTSLPAPANTSYTKQDNKSKSSVLSSSKTYRIVLLILDNPNYTFTDLPDGSVYTVWDEGLQFYKYYSGRNLSLEEAEQLKESIYLKGYRVGEIVEQ